MTYKGMDGKYPDFEDVKLNGEPVNVCGKKVQLDGFTTRERDKNKATEILLSRGENIPVGYVWHHSQDMRTLIQVNKYLHQKFTHKGGFSLSR